MTDYFTIDTMRTIIDQLNFYLPEHLHYNLIEGHINSSKYMISLKSDGQAINFNTGYILNESSSEMMIELPASFKKYFKLPTSHLSDMFVKVCDYIVENEQLIDKNVLLALENFDIPLESSFKMLKPLMVSKYGAVNMESKLKYDPLTALLYIDYVIHFNLNSSKFPPISINLNKMITSQECQDMCFWGIGKFYQLHFYKNIIDKPLRDMTNEEKKLIEIYFF